MATGAWLATHADAADLLIDATVDKTNVELGESITLTITIRGDISRLKQGPQVNLPDAFHVAARSEGSNLSIRGGTMERSVSFVFVLVSSQPGTFQLGPFQIDHGGTALATEPIEIVVKRSILPPQSEPSQRYVL